MPDSVSLHNISDHPVKLTVCSTTIGTRESLTTGFAASSENPSSPGKGEGENPNFLAGIRDILDGPAEHREASGRNGESRDISIRFAWVIWQADYGCVYGKRQSYMQGEMVDGMAESLSSTLKREERVT